jgi:hypothetical protein
MTPAPTTSTTNLTAFGGPAAGKQQPQQGTPKQMKSARLAAAAATSSTTASNNQSSAAKTKTVPSNPKNIPPIDFNMLTLATLRKYKRHHHLRIKPTVSKAELVEVVTAHFATEMVAPSSADQENRLIDAFVAAVRKEREEGDGRREQAALLGRGLGGGSGSAFGGAGDLGSPSVHERKSKSRGHGKRVTKPGRGHHSKNKGSTGRTRKGSVSEMSTGSP